MKYPTEFYRVIPDRVLALLLSSALKGAELHLCLHRVGKPDPADTLGADCFIEASTLDDLIRVLRGNGKAPNATRFVVSFDDGYADAVGYVTSRHPSFPDVSWVFFICPAKIRDRTGFDWDAKRLVSGAPLPSIVQEGTKSETLPRLT